jgi:tetratricopeptide (TPR) repeat protein
VTVVARRHLLTLAVASGVFALAFDAGGYSLTTRNAVAIAIWWAIGLSVALSLLPLARPARATVVAGSALIALAALSALSVAWADSAERAFAEFNRVALYVGVFALVALGSRRANVRQWRDGLALGITAIGLLALVSRLYPDLLTDPGSFRFLPGGDDRLSYPLDYWNGLGIFTALAFPLLLGAATGARTAVGRGAAVAPLPALFATIFLTSSRGAAATAIVGIVVFCTLTTRRITAIACTLAGAAGSALVVAVLLARDQLVDGPLASAAAADQGRSAAFLIALACIGTGALVALVSRFAPRRELVLGRRVRIALAALGIAAVAAGVVAADPVGRFNTFKKPPDEFQAIQTDFTRAHLLSESGSGRWQFWETAADEFQDRPVLGDGAGSFESYWAQHGDLFRFIRDAHSLYFETLAELGLVGFALLAVALGTAFLTTARRLRASGAEQRVMVASLAALLVAWCVAAGIDWMWELTAVGVLGIIALALLTGPATTPAPFPDPDPVEPEYAGGARQQFQLHGRRYLVAVSAVIALSLFTLVTQAVPLLAQMRIGDSQAAVERGDAASALDNALDARSLQPWAASPHLQLALVREQLDDLRAARASIDDAIGKDRTDWRLWLVQARLETKAGEFGAARHSLRRARALNPRSPLFAGDGNG